ncbi:MAG: M23 family metallopeptidase [Coriobacteriaceae bacterium]|nr:M23 family metallopeptidase [Coriobacteriaceae bacterium]
MSPGQRVDRGQNIAAVGNTGNSFGSHLHFQVEVNGVAVDPLLFI